MIRSLLIANRGEIACRIIRTARSLGIRTVAVYSDADADALHVRQADEAVHIGPSPPRESYLAGDRIIAAAQAAGAEAVHPGYGFLSENAQFAQAVIDAGLVWVGPSPATIATMGLKDAAKALMAEAGVPVTPGYMGAEQDAVFLAERAAEIGYPVLIKAVAGGGGKGMRLVAQSDDFADALASCRREASAAFDNDRVLIEKYIERPRHIEVQVFGDTHGNIVHLFERDCSLQRRHQKVIEEAPAPNMDTATREALCCAAIRAAKAVNYVGAGTVEFIADASAGLRPDRIWFMEMNTRLQVEHPVTEAITGVDLVEWQLRVASGEGLSKAQDELAIDGWAMEARLYAEDPAKEFLPSTGCLEHCHFPEGVRIDTGVEQGSEVSPHYDPMIAKIIIRADNRKNAAALLQQKIGAFAAWPLKTNAAFLFRAAGHPRFRAGDITTDFIADHLDELVPSDVPSSLLLGQAARVMVRRTMEGCAVAAPGFRLNAPPRLTVHVEVDGIGYVVDADRWPVDTICASALGRDGALASQDGLTFGVLQRRDRGAAGDVDASGAIFAPMPGRVIAVAVAPGDAVIKGQKLLTLEAMKMEHTLTAPFAGTVAELNTAPGGQVKVRAVLARIEAEGK